MPEQTHADRLADLLHSLGDNADAIADRLRALEIKGLRKDCATCPLAEFLRHVGGYDEAYVGDAAITAYRANEPRAEVVPPPAVVAFIERFDKGVYLDLVEVVPADD